MIPAQDPLTSADRHILENELKLKPFKIEAIPDLANPHSTLCTDGFLLRLGHKRSDASHLHCRPDVGRQDPRAQTYVEYLHRSHPHVPVLLHRQAG